MPFRKSRAWGQTKPPVGYGLDWGDPINAQLGGRWLFNENAGGTVYDLCDRTDCVFTNAPTWSQGGNGSAIKFASASSQWIDGGLTGPCVNLNANVSGSIWFKLNGNYTSGQVMMASSDSSAAVISYAVTFGYTDNKVEFWQFNNIKATSTISISDDNWHHVVFTRQGVTNSSAQTINLYIDGVLDKTQARTDNFTASANRFAFSRFGAFNSAFFEGRLDNAAIWPNRILAASDAMRLYTEPFAGIITPRRRIISQAAAGGFKPYWASQRSRVIGGGVI